MRAFKFSESQRARLNEATQSLRLGYIRHDKQTVIPVPRALLLLLTSYPVLSYLALFFPSSLS